MPTDKNPKICVICFQKVFVDYLLRTAPFYTMLKFILSLLYPAVLLPLFLRWGGQQVEGQMDKMQAAAFNTPGAEAPVPPQVLLGGGLLIVGHLFVARTLLQQKGWQAWFGLVLGSALGVMLYLRNQSQDSNNK